MKKISFQASFAAKITVILLTLTLILPASAQGTSLQEQINRLGSEIDAKKEAANQTKTELEGLSANLNQIISEYQAAFNELTAVEEALAKNQQELNSAIEQQSYYQEILNERAVFAYRNGDVYLLEIFLGTKDFQDFLVRLDFLIKISQRDAQVLTAAKRLKQEIEERRRTLEEQKEEQKKLVTALQTKQASLNELLAQQQTLLTNLEGEIANLQTEKEKKEAEKKAEEERLAREAALRASSGGSVAQISMIFPIPSPYAHGFINDWGFPRAGNPAGHQGTDIFAQKGTPVVAVTNGVIGDQFGMSRVGGYRLHLISDTGVNFYYAHLNNDSPGTDDNAGGPGQAYAPGIAPGVRVTAGQVLGYVGDSGDAEPTPPHLHFGITINDTWINPYPHLKAFDWK